MRIAIGSRPDWPASLEAAKAVSDKLRKAGHQPTELALDSRAMPKEVERAEIALVFGGDGTVLRAARALSPFDIPILGVNLGRLGFLTATTIDQIDAAIADVLAGRFTIEERALLDARLVRGGKEVVRALALNDVVVARGKQVRSINVAVRVDGEPLITYWADGLIVATATGSTAYGFSVGGPLILPASRTITMVPIAPHLSFGNAVVFDPDQVLELETQDEPSVLSLDGQEEHDLQAGDRITVRRAATVARFARTAHARPFVELLREKILKEPGT
ncbi:MAG: NAD(+)/NADH kinase [Chloroflexota bacterium]|nr:NAD(+)/NADH kinase [Chloroflexota bacterium]